MRNRLFVILAALAIPAGVTAWVFITGLFRPPEIYPTGAYPLDVAVADIDGDGHLDLVTDTTDFTAESLIDLVVTRHRMPYASVFDPFPNLVTVDFDESTLSVSLGAKPE